MRLHALLLFTALTLTAAACGGSTSTDVGSDTSGQSDNAAVTNAQETVDEITESVEEAQAASGGGSATLTVGDQSWTFSSLLCSFGDEDAEFVMSSIQDGTQLYASIDSFGHYVSLDDVSDFENPSVSIDSTGSYTDIVLEGKNFSATGEFLDGTTDSFERVPGTLNGTCP